jgi:lipopolysaccharide/colanic/teichoic acid biosynthesis glycosyltransferase
MFSDQRNYNPKTIIMQVELLQNLPHNDEKDYLRVATISNEKNVLSFLYIGTDNSAIQSLSTTFHSGFTADNLENARQLIISESFREQKIDVIIIDIPYNEPELKYFQSFLKTSGILPINTPVLFNTDNLEEDNGNFNYDLVDDVIDLKNWQYDFTSKINFLKKAKEYQKPENEKSARIESSDSAFKRFFDILVSLVLLLMLLPVMILIAIAIKIESKGPVFYNAKRAGRGFRIFKFYKFRTMVVNADKKIEALAHLNQYRDNENGPKFFKISNDPRVTRVGRFLRNTSLDELPQLFNVLKGDMSLVGNRPLPLYEAATLTTNEFVERFMAPAGITGLWQIKKRGRDEMSIDERISLDISYARKSTMLYDLWIMARTPRALFQKSDV